MPNIDLKKLPSAAEPVPAGTEIQPPAPALEAEMAMRTKASEAQARAAMRTQTQRIPPPLVAKSNATPPAPVEAPTGAELESIKARLRERSNPSTGEFKVDPPLSAACNLIYDKVCSMSGEWSQKLDAMKVERGLRKDQIVCALVANSLDLNMHMTIPADHAYFTEAHKPGGTNFTCVICDQPQSRAYAGQPPLCVSADNRCATKFYALSKEDQKELLEAAA